MISWRFQAGQSLQIQEAAAQSTMSTPATKDENCCLDPQSTEMSTLSTSVNTSPSTLANPGDDVNQLTNLSQVVGRHFSGKYPLLSFPFLVCVLCMLIFLCQSATIPLAVLPQTIISNSRRSVELTQSITKLQSLHYMLQCYTVKLWDW